MATTLRRVVRRTLPTQLRALLVPPPAWLIGVCESADPLAPLASGPPRLILTADELAEHDLTFVADPFAIHRAGRWFLFFEAVARGSRRGAIALATSPDLRSWTYEGVVLTEAFHLSFPHLLEQDGQTFMVPESSADRSVRLYRARAFPHDWTLDRVLLRGRAFKDTTILRRDGHFFMFTETSEAHTNDQLRLYTADHLQGPWVEHPASPVVTRDADVARPAGRPITVDHQLVRFTQCCASRYGAAVRAHAITELGLSGYREESRPGTVVSGGGHGWRARAMHHVDAHEVAGGWVVFVDGHA